MESILKTYNYSDGTIQRVQLVRPESWQALEFFDLHYCEGALDCFEKIFRQYLIPACPWIFGNLVLFHIPEGMEVPFSRDTGKFGVVADDLTAAAAALRSGLRITGSGPAFRDETVKQFYGELKKRGCVRIVSGRLPVTTIIPVGAAPGFLSRTAEEAALKVNASFFIMDPFDCATVYDHVGTCLGLMVKEGRVLNPPLYGREALLIQKGGTVSVRETDIRQLSIQIGPARFRHGENAVIYTRPEHPRTPAGKGVDLVIVGRRVAAVRQGGRVPVPASGFVLRVAEGWDIHPGDEVCYSGMEQVLFGIQVGNSIVRNGVKTERFLSRFYNIRHLQPVPYPPSLYPVNFRRGRAARIALGADRKGRPMLLWAEGAPKLGYIPGKHSRGASLADMAEICTELGMVNAVNLDGGGSAQILLHNRRALEVSDRNPDKTEAERLVPNALIIK